MSRTSARTGGPEETEALGAELASTLEPGDVVLVQGELGAGKTTFIRGACRALGVRTVVTSPTFTIAQRYIAPVPVSHVDLFRVGGLEEEDPDLLADYLGPGMIAFVEWPQGSEDTLASLARIAARVRIDVLDGDEAPVQGPPPPFSRVVEITRIA